MQHYIYISIETITQMKLYLKGIFISLQIPYITPLVLVIIGKLGVDIMFTLSIIINI